MTCTKTHSATYHQNNLSNYSDSIFLSVSHTPNSYAHHITNNGSLHGLGFVQTSAEEGKQEKKSDQPPQAKKPKVKTKVLELPIENNPQWQLANDMLNLFVESEVCFPCRQKLGKRFQQRVQSTVKFFLLRVR